jgi:hypothetical protein
LRLCGAPCVAMGSCFSTLGESRGDAALKECDTAEEGVDRRVPVFGDRLISAALTGVTPPDTADPGVTSAVLLDLELSLRGAGEPLRSMAGDLGGTSGGAVELAVSTLRDGFAPGLKIGESGLPLLLSLRDVGVACCVRTGDGPVMQEIIASPKGPDLQAVPGALLDRS